MSSRTWRGGKCGRSCQLIRVRLPLSFAFRQELCDRKAIVTDQMVVNARQAKGQQTALV